VSCLWEAWRARLGTAEEAAPSSITSFLVAVWLAGLFFFCFTYFYQSYDWEQIARLDTTVAIVNHGTFAIDRYQQNTGDKSFYDGSGAQHRPRIMVAR
jgi:hypothetical protein